MAKMTADATADGARVTGLRGLPGWTVEVSFRSGAVTLTPPAGATVDAEVWRKVTIGAVMRKAHSLHRGDVLNAMLAMLASDGSDPARSSRGGRRSHLSRVAAVYRLALEHNIPPQEALAEHFEVESPRTTQRWITDARKEGLLGAHRDELSRARTYDPHQPDGSRRVRGPHSITTREDT